MDSHKKPIWADIAIIGGGLAGLSAAAAAVAASNSRAAIVIVERLGIGSNRTTPMTFADVPERFVITPSILARYGKFTFHSPLGQRSTHTYENTPLVALDYRHACKTLLERARSAGDIHLIHASARELARRNGQWQISLSDRQTIQSPLLIDASGRALFTSRQLGLARPRMFSHSYGGRYSPVEVPDQQEVYFLAPSVFGNGGGWLYPLPNGQVSFGFAILSKDQRFPGAAAKKNLRQALYEFEPYHSWLENASLIEIEAGSIPVFPLRRFIYDGLMIIGDAAGQATIWSCMGSESALESGQLAGEAAAQAHTAGNFSARFLEHYQTKWDQRHRRVYQRNGWVAPVSWGMTSDQWNRQITLLPRLTPQQMIDRLRINWPVPSLPMILFIRLYDLAGRIRRGLVKRIREITKEL